MIIEFVLWIVLAAVLSPLLQSAAALSPLMALLIAAPASALGISLVRWVGNRRFTSRAVSCTARVEKLLPPLRSGGLPRVQLSLPGQSQPVILTPEEAPAVGEEMTVWVWGRRVQEALPSPRSAFRILGVCAALMALAALGYICTLLLPDPTKGN